MSTTSRIPEPHQRAASYIVRVLRAASTASMTDRDVRFPQIPALPPAAKSVARECVAVLAAYERGELAMRQAVSSVTRMISGDSYLRSIFLDDWIDLESILAGSASADLSAKTGTCEAIDRHLASLRAEMTFEISRTQPRDVEK